MRSDLLRLIGEELRLLRAEGVESVSLSDETLRILDRQPQPRKAEPAAPQQAASPKIEVPRLEPKAPATASKAAQRKSNPLLANPPQFTLPEGSKEERWQWLREKVLNCEVCQKHLNPDKKIVFGVGNLDADIFFCGEAPGADEETQGEPFVGKAGELLTGMIKAMGLVRENVYIGNIMNWRPQTGSSFGNRPPTDEEMAFCLPYLTAQIEVVQPKVIVAMGGTAVKGLLGIETRGQMGRLRGNWKEFSNTPVMITYHPSYLLHQDSVASKRKVWEDLLAVMERLEMEISQKQRNFFLSALKRG
ncbi:MAG: uracil-DNA glycosylase [Puniceicoccales bacterium]